VPPGSALAAMERRARERGPALFSPGGLLEQVRRLVKGGDGGSGGAGGGEDNGESALGCVPKPDTLRVPWQQHWDTTSHLDNFDLKLPGEARL